MSQPIFSVDADGRQYSIVLPDWETDYIQRMLAEKEAPYELAMLQAMGAVLHEDDLVLDVGANIGNHALYLALVAGCRVIAFEPNPLLSVPLAESIAINGLEGRVSIIANGVGATEAKGVFAALKPDNLGSQSLTLIDEADQSDDSAMPVVPLDSMTFDGSVKAIKIDVEGMELDVLQGAARLIEMDRPKLFIESSDEEQFCAIHDFLDGWGYVYWRTFNATPTNWFVPLDTIAQEDLQQHGREQGKTFYRIWDERQRLRKSLLDLREKKRLVDERLVELQERLDKANSEVRELTSLSEEATDKSAAQDPEKAVGVEFSACSGEKAHPERAIGLDFSLPEERAPKLQSDTRQ